MRLGGPWPRYASANSSRGKDRPVGERAACHPVAAHSGRRGVGFRLRKTRSLTACASETPRSLDVNTERRTPDRRSTRPTDERPTSDGKTEYTLPSSGHTSLCSGRGPSCQRCLKPEEVTLKATKTPAAPPTDWTQMQSRAIAKRTQSPDKRRIPARPHRYRSYIETGPAHWKELRRVIRKARTRVCQ